MPPKRRSSLPLGLTTSQLTHLGQQLLPHFSGVSSCDTLNQIFPDFSVTRSCIINLLEQHFTRGGHWISLFFDAHKQRLYYWDPYGFPPANAYIVAFLKKAPVKVTHYSQRVQSLWSIYCGFFCMAFLIHKERQLPTPAFFRIFDTQDHHVNDDIVVLFIKACIDQGVPAATAALRMR